MGNKNKSSSPISVRHKVLLQLTFTSSKESSTFSSHLFLIHHYKICRGSQVPANHCRDIEAWEGLQQGHEEAPEGTGDNQEKAIEGKLASSSKICPAKNKRMVNWIFSFIKNNSVCSITFYIVHFFWQQLICTFWLLLPKYHNVGPKYWLIFTIFSK